MNEEFNQFDMKNFEKENDLQSNTNQIQQPTKGASKWSFVLTVIFFVITVVAAVMVCPMLYEGFMQSDKTAGEAVGTIVVLLVALPMFAFSLIPVALTAVFGLIHFFKTNNKATKIIALVFACVAVFYALAAIVAIFIVGVVN